MLAKSNIKAYVKDLQEQHAKAVNTDAEWMRKELLKMQQLAIDKGDLANANKTIDMLNRINGHYEKDNTQKNDNINLKMEF